jgi:hypothetical protein
MSQCDALANRMTGSSLGCVEEKRFATFRSAMRLTICDAMPPEWAAIQVCPGVGMLARQAGNRLNSVAEAQTNLSEFPGCVVAERSPNASALPDGA